MSEQKIVPFLFEGENLIRVVERISQPWFVAKDVCQTLGIVWKGSDSTGPLGSLDDDEKGVSSVHTPGGYQDMVVVNESGLYAIIFKSRKPEAVRFRKWVTNEVLPAIRRTGGYGPDLSRPAEELAESDLPEGTRLKMVSETRLTWGIEAAQEVWVAAGLPMTPAMHAARRQSDLFRNGGAH